MKPAIMTEADMAAREPKMPIEARREYEQEADRRNEALRRFVSRRTT